MISADGQGKGAPCRKEKVAGEVVPVFFTVDDSYAPWLAVALNSLVRNARSARPYEVIILNEDLTEAHKAALREIAAGNGNVELTFVDMAERIHGIEDLSCNKLRADYFTLSIFYRLFIPDMFPCYDKVVYLDADIVVEADVADLFDTEMKGNLIGACQDHSILGIPELETYTSMGMGFPIEEYINSGMLLMDAAALREHKLAERFLELLDRYHFRTIAPDQDYLNALCHGKILYLAPEWDAMPVEGKAELPNPKIVHYNLFMKPWCYDNVPYGERFWNYVEGTGFEEAIRAFKDSYSLERKDHDARALQRILDNGVSIANEEVNFRTIFGGGKEARL